MPRLRVVAGPSIEALVPISTNSDVPHTIVSDAFEGQILTYVKDFTDEHGNVLDSEYFGREDRKGITWSVQVQGMSLRMFLPLRKTGPVNPMAHTRAFPPPDIGRRCAFR
jgi:hypothetical protein